MLAQGLTLVFIGFGLFFGMFSIAAAMVLVAWIGRMPPLKGPNDE